MSHQSALPRLIGIFLFLLPLFGTLSLSAPIPTSRPSTPTPKTCPTSDTIAKWLRDRKVIGANTIFYSSPATNQEAGILASKLNPKGHYFGDLIATEQQLDWIGECPPGPEQDKVVPRISKAIAMEATGTAYLLVHSGKQPSANSIWMKHEFPTLQRNTKITEVKEIEYEKIGDLKSAKPIWVASANKPKLPASTADN